MTENFEISEEAVAPVANEVGRSPSTFSTGDEAGSGPLAPGQRWSVRRKRDVVLRLLRGEPVDGLSRELGVEVYRLERWREKALSGIDASLKKRQADPLDAELGAALKRVGELTMENELLRARIDRPGPLGRRRSRR